MDDIWLKLDSFKDNVYIYIYISFHCLPNLKCCGNNKTGVSRSISTSSLLMCLTLWIMIMCSSEPLKFLARSEMQSDSCWHAWTHFWYSVVPGILSKKILKASHTASWQTNKQTHTLKQRRESLLSTSMEGLSVWEVRMSLNAPLTVTLRCLWPAVFRAAEQRSRCEAHVCVGGPHWALHKHSCMAWGRWSTSELVIPLVAGEHLVEGLLGADLHPGVKEHWPPGSPSGHLEPWAFRLRGRPQQLRQAGPPTGRRP